MQNSINHIEQFSAEDIIGITLQAKKKIIARTLPSLTAQVYKEYNKGGIVGKVYSWVTVSGSLYWQFMDLSGNMYYVEHEAGIFDISYVSDQGVLSTKEKKAAAKKALESDKSVFQVLKENTISVIKYGKWIGIAVLSLVLIIFIYKKYAKIS